MATGDWPPSALRATGLVLPLHFLAWPWLYVALLAASLVCLASAGALGVARPARTDFLQPAIGLLAAAFLISVLFSQVPSLSWFAFGCFLAIGGFSLAVARVVEDDTALAGTCAALAAAALFLALRVVSWRFHEGLTTADAYVRNNAWLGKLQITWVLNLLAPLLLARFMEERVIVTSALYAVAWLLSDAAVLLLFSRAGWVAFALTTVCLCALNHHYWRRWLGLLTAGVAIAFVLITLSGGMSGRLVASLIGFDRDPGIVMRETVWRDTVHMIADHPIAGIGLGTYDDVAYSQYQISADRHFFRNGWHAHNVFLHILAETGTLGFLAWCYLWYVVVRFLVRRWRERAPAERLHSTAALCVILAFVVLSLTEDLIAARVYASLRMNLTLGLVVVTSVRLAARARPAGSA